MLLSLSLIARSSLLSCFALSTLVLSGCRSGSFPQYSSDYREYAYIANSGSDTVSVLDLVHVRQQTVLQVGLHPVALVANPRRNEIYAITQGAPGATGSLAIIDAETNQVVAKLTLGQSPQAAVVSSDGKLLYVANTGANSVSIVNLDTRRQIAVVGAGEQPSALAIAPDGQTLVVANRQSGSVSLFDVSSQRPPALRTSFSGCPGAGSLVVLPDSSKAFVACSAGHQVMAIGLRTAAAPQKKSYGIHIVEPDRLLCLLDVGANPVRLILKPDGGEIFVANHDADTISEIETGANEVGGATLIGSHPASGIVSADNTMLWVANEGADSIAVYSVDDGKLIHTVHVGAGPGALAFSADGHLLLAANRRSGDISLLRTFSRNVHREPVYGTLFTMLPAGSEPAAIVDKAFHVTR